ncbi:hypothetical protein PENTCL1PPCAC_30397, partial [Pristionchus entomophagus]
LLEVGERQLVAHFLGGLLEIVHGRLLTEVLGALDDILADLAEHAIENLGLSGLDESMVVGLDVPALWLLVQLGGFLDELLLALMHGLTKKSRSRDGDNQSEKDDGRAHCEGERLREIGAGQCLT